jgi:hypothetical protein
LPKTKIRHSLILFLLSLALFNINPRVYLNFDTISTALIPIVLNTRGDFVMDDFHAYFTDNRLIAGDNQYFFQETRYGFLPAYPVATGLLLTPFYRLPVHFYDRPGLTASDWFVFSTTAQRIAASLIASLSVVLFYLIAGEMGAGQRLAFLLTLAFAFATEEWCISSQLLWQHGPGILFILAAAFAALAQARSPGRLKGICFGLACGLALAIRPTNLLYVVPMFLWMAARQPRYLLSYAWPPGIIGSGVAAYNLIVLGDIRGADIYLRLMNTPLWEGISGLMWSPARGLIIYFPLALLGTAGFFLAMRERNSLRSFYVTMMTAVIGQLILISKWSNWWGGETFGPRLLSETEPFLLIFAIPLFLRSGRKLWLQASFCLFFAWSAAIQLVGVFTDYQGLNWNHFPDYSDVPRKRFWNWENSPIIWEARREIGKLTHGKKGLLNFIEGRALAGDAESQVWMGKLFQHGLGVKRDDSEALRWYRLASNQGNPEGEVSLGILYRDGLGTAKNDREAVRWFTRAAREGDPVGEVGAGLMYHLGRGVEKDDGEALRLFKKAAGQGDYDGAIDLGQMYLNGFGVMKDEAEAVRWFLKAEQIRELEPALNRLLGKLYLGGSGVRRDDAEALKRIKKAVAHGDTGAENDLGVLYHEGLGVKKESATALAWFLRAAKRGNSAAGLNAAVLYRNGDGTPKNEEEALKWSRKGLEKRDGEPEKGIEGILPK